MKDRAKQPGVRPTVINTSNRQKIQFKDNNSHNIEQRLLSNSIQRFKMGPTDTRQVTIQGTDNKTTFTECVSNSVEYKEGDKRESGSDASGEEWAGWLKDGSQKSNNAVRMHIVNRDWGGDGEISNGNIIPGSTDLNNKHKSQAENIFFEECFGGRNKKTAKKNCIYKCTVQKGYEDYIDATKSTHIKDNSLLIEITGKPSITVRSDKGMNVKDVKTRLPSKKAPR